MWQHKCLSELHRQLLDKGIIEIGGEVDGDMAMYVREALLRLTAKGSPDITVLITSNGGSVTCGLDICDALNYYKGKKTGVVQAFAKSMAAIILQACDRRQAMCHATIHIHHVSMTQMSLDVMRNRAKFAKAKEGAEKNQARLYKILSERTGHNIPRIRKECAKDQGMSAEEALAFGLIDEII